jgi:sensor histidine kinase YesM
MEKPNNFLDQIMQNRVLTHVLFWLGVLTMAPITSDESITEIGEAFLFRAVALPTKIIATYWLAYFLIPVLLQKKKYIEFIVSFLLSSIILTYIYRINNVHIAERLAGLTTPKESIPQMISEFWYTVFAYFPRVYFYSLIFIFIKTVKGRAVEKHRIEVLEKEKATAELNFLKAQIHPHFLFNTLNNLYVLTLDKSDKAPEVVARLSEMLDYMLYQCREDKVRISQEVELLEHYIDLEKLRYGDRLQLDFVHSIDDPQTRVAPLILVSIIENAFKHGVSGTIQQAVIKIKLAVENRNLHFQVFNTKAAVAQVDKMNYKEGIGIKNVQRQLELLYPDQYQMTIDEEEETYEVNLWIRG